VNTPDPGSPRRSRVAPAAALAAACLALLVGDGGVTASGPSAPAGPRPRAAAPAEPARYELLGAAGSELRVSYELDPRLTRGLYLGERWVSPPTYTRLQGGDALTIRARAHRVEQGGAPRRVDATWTSSGPDIVAVAPGRGHEVVITARRPGEAVLTVTHAGASRTLSVTAAKVRGVLRVDISR
jgi:hypothetical protein